MAWSTNWPARGYHRLQRCCHCFNFQPFIRGELASCDHGDGVCAGCAVEGAAKLCKKHGDEGTTEGVGIVGTFGFQVPVSTLARFPTSLLFGSSLAVR